ncbi:hypothetical protein NE237_010874 [Protea cynaroides]|uniref:Uncharacterized protein n=1 Tax=Protea cynaroides TaxID=273540 RepID=A0A9Q0L185_9MAGN|nr:hypothetical protein NE237_010874 [Protea cynaroides]
MPELEGGVGGGRRWSRMVEGDVAGEGLRKMRVRLVSVRIARSKVGGGVSGMDGGALGCVRYRLHKCCSRVVVLYTGEGSGLVMVLKQVAKVFGHGNGMDRWCFALSQVFQGCSATWPHTTCIGYVHSPSDLTGQDARGAEVHGRGAAAHPVGSAGHYWSTR